MILTVQHTFGKMKIIVLDNINEEEDTIKDVKQKLSEKLNVNVENDYLFYKKERLMNENQKIKDLQIKETDRILLIKNYVQKVLL